MITLTEQQRQEAIAACDRIQELNAKVQMHAENVLRILDNMANRRDPKDGLKTTPSALT